MRAWLLPRLGSTQSGTIAAVVNALSKAGVELGEHGGVVNPVLSLWRLIDRGDKLWLDEPEPL